MKAKILLFTAILIGIKSFSQNINLVNLGNIYTYQLQDIRTIDGVANGKDKYVLYWFRETSASQLKSAILKLDINDNVVFNKAYYISNSANLNQGFHLYRLYSGSADGYLYGIGQSRLDYTCYILQIDPSNGSVANAYNFSYPNAPATLWPEDIKVTTQYGTSIYVLANKQLSPGTKHVVIKFTPSSGATVVKEVTNPNVHPYTGDRAIQLVHVVPDPSLVRFSLSLSHYNGSEYGLTYVDYDFWQTGFHATRINYNDGLGNTRSFIYNQFGIYDNFLFLSGQLSIGQQPIMFFTRFDGGGPLVVQYHASYYNSKFYMFPHGEDINDHGKSIQPKFFGIYLDGTDRGYVLGEIDNTLNITKSHLYTLNSFPIDIINPDKPLHTDYWDGSGNVTPFFVAPRAAPENSNIYNTNKFYYWNDYDENCKENFPFEDRSSSIVLQEDDNYDIIDGPDIDMEPVSILTSNMSASLNSICSEEYERESGFIQKSLIADPRDSVFAYEEEGGGGLRLRNPVSDISKKQIKTGNDYLQATYTGAGIRIQSSKLVNDISIIGIDGKLLYRRTNLNSSSCDLPILLNSKVLILNLVYNDGKTTVKKIILNQ